MPVSINHIRTNEEISSWPDLWNIQLPNFAAEIGYFGIDAPGTLVSYDKITRPGWSCHKDRIVCKVLMENNAGTSDMKKVTIKWYHECDIKLLRIGQDTNFDYDFQVRATGKKERTYSSSKIKTFWSKLDNPLNIKMVITP